MIRNVELAREALRMALRLRRSAGSDASSPICVFDLAECRSIEVKFAAIGSMEGMYVQAAKPVIIVPSQRPPGRQAFACAHEMGHHQFGHGSHIDECLSDEGPNRGYDAKERIADLFAAQLLMPKAAVLRAFRRRGWNVVTSSPEEVFTVAGQLGVGYVTLINQLRHTHQLISNRHAGELLKRSPKAVRESMLRRPGHGDLLVVDLFWEVRAVDVQVGDEILLPYGVCFEGRCVKRQESVGTRTVVRAVRPGCDQAWLRERNWATWIRVSRRDYTGRSCFRHLEDPDDHSSTATD